MGAKLNNVIVGMALAALAMNAPALAKQPDLGSGNALSRPIPEAIKTRYALVQKLIGENASPKAIGDALYWPDVIIAGEGGATQKGFDQMMAGMPETLAFIGDQCTFIFTDPAIVTKSLVAAYSGFNCKKGAEPDLDIRILYVWQKRGTIWKVVRESYTMEVK